MPSWKKVIVSGSNAELLSVTASFLGNLAGTASFANNSTSASYALTASYVRVAESTSFAPNLYNTDGTLPNSTRTVTFLSSTILRFDLSSSVAGSPRVLFDTSNVASGVRFTGSGYVNLDTTAVSLAGVSNLAQANIIGRDSLGGLTYFSTSSIKLVQSASFAATASYFSGSIANAIIADSASRVLIVYDDQPQASDVYYLTYARPVSGTYEFLQNDRSLRYDSGIRTLYATNFSGAFSGSLFGTAATASFAPNIYNSNGTLNGSRLVDLNGQDLTFNADGGDFIIISNPGNTVSIESLTTGSAPNLIFQTPGDGKLYTSPTSSFTASFAVSASRAVSASFAQTAVTASFASTASYVSGAVIAPGSDTQVVFNNAGVLAANSGFVYSGSRVGIGTTAPADVLHLNGTNTKVAIQGANVAGGIQGVQFLHTATSTAGYIGSITTSGGGSGTLVFNTIHSGSGELMRITNTGFVGIGTNAPTVRLQVRGAGATSATTTFLLQNSTPANLMQVLDNGQFAITSPVISLSPSQSAFSISQSISQSATVGAQVYGVNITPTFFATTNGQTETAFRVNATFTGSALATGSSNIIADFGATSAGSQLTITDVTSGSIYMVNDVSGLPIVEATSDWTFNLYNYPNIILQKTGSTVNISGSLRVTGSASLVGFLAVTGSVSASSYTGSFSGSVTAPGSTSQVVYNSAGALAADSGFVYTGSRVGIGIALPTAQLHVVSSSTSIPVKAHIQNTAATGQAGIDFQVNTQQTRLITAHSLPFSIYDQTATAERFTLTSAGNIGIGETTPTARLEVKGSGTTSATTALRVEDSNASSSLVVLDNGFTGIGLTAPTARLEVYNGSAKFWHGGTTYFTAFTQSNEINTYDSANAASTMYLNYHSGPVNISNGKIVAIAGGNVGIGNSAPAFRLDVAGTARFSNNVSVTGSVSASSFTGSLFGTASFATNATSASFASTASYVLQAVSASFASTAQTATTASYVLNAVSASFAPNIYTSDGTLNSSRAVTLNGNNLTFNATSSAANVSFYLTSPGTFEISGSNRVQIKGLDTLAQANILAINVSTGQISSFATSSIQNVISSSFATSASQAGNSNTINVNSFGSPVDSYLLMSNVIATPGVAIGGDSDLRYNASTNVLTVTNISATSLTGSLLGTASFAANATSASFASTASYVLNAISASFVTSASFATTASFALSVVSASFAATSSRATSASFATNAVNAVNTEYAYVEENDIDATYYLVLANNTADYIRLSADKNNANYNASTGTLTVVQLVETSARRFKENIEPLKGSLERVQQLQGVSFNRIGDSEKKIGFIAEDVAQVYPELVEYNKEGEVQGLAYQRTVAVLVEAVKELTDKLQAQEVFIKDLESRIKNLEAN